MATLRSIDVVRGCPKCGPVEDFTEIGGTAFCSRCLAVVLRDRLMVPVAEMQTVRNEIETGLYNYECPFCGKLRDTGESACPHCGKQEER